MALASPDRRYPREQHHNGVVATLATIKVVVWLPLYLFDQGG